MFKRISAVFAYQVLCVFCGMGQSVQVDGGFISDSVSVGKPVGYYLTARYPMDMTVLFPDSTFDFQPFEFSRKKFFPTVTRDSLSLDSAVYTLTSFEIDSLQFLSLPLFVVQKSDCLRVRSRMDTVVFRPRVASDPNTKLADLPLRENTGYRHLVSQFNYLIAGIIGTILLVVLVVGWLVFKDRTYRYIKSIGLKRRHQVFIRQFNRAVQVWEQKRGATEAERALAIWKNYLEGLLAEPISTYTTRQIREKLNDIELNEQLTLVDGIIYGRQQLQENPFEELKAFGEDTYYGKLTSLQHGRS